LISFVDYLTNGCIFLLTVSLGACSDLSQLASKVSSREIRFDSRSAEQSGTARGFFLHASIFFHLHRPASAPYSLLQLSLKLCNLRNWEFC